MPEPYLFAGIGRLVRCWRHRLAGRRQEKQWRLDRLAAARKQQQQETDPRRAWGRDDGEPGPVRRLLHRIHAKRGN